LYGVRDSSAALPKNDAPQLLLGGQPDAPVAVQLIGGGDPLGRAELRTWGASGRCG
jgi:hypothetical protein